MSITDDERFVLDEELEAAVQQDLAAWRAIQERPDYLAERARDLDGQLRDMEDLIHEGIIYRRHRKNLTRYLGRDPFSRRTPRSRAHHSI